MRRLPGRRSGIVTDLTLLIGAVLLPFLLLNGYLAYRAVREEREEVHATVLREAEETAQRADELVIETRALLTVLARSPTLRDENPATTRAFLLDLKERFPYCESFFAANADGTVYVSTAGTLGEAGAVADQPYFQAAIREDRWVVSDVLVSRATSQPVAVAIMPIHASNGVGRVVGAVAVTLDLIRLQDWLEDRSLPLESTITVVDDQGRILVHSDDPERWVGQTAAGVPVVQAAITRGEGIMDGTGVDGARRLYGFATTEEVPWHILVRAPGAAMQGPLQQEIRRMILWLGLAALVTVALALAVGRRIVQPVRRLTAGADRIAAGDLAHRIAVGRRDDRDGDEVARLGLAMNRMADELLGLVEAHRQAQERLEVAVTQVGRALTSAVEPAAMLTPLVEAAVALTRADAGLLLFRDDAPPVTAGDLPPISPPLLASLAEQCDGLGEPPAVLGATSQALGMRECLGVAVRARGALLATLLVFRRENRPFGDDDARLLGAFADQAAVAIEQSRLRAAVAQAEALRELHRLQSDFIATASHELRAPLAGIKGYAEVLLRDDLPLDEDTRHECLVGIDHLADHLAGQVRAFFDAVRAGAGQFALRREPVDVAAMATAVVHSFAARAPGHDFRLTVAPDLPPALGDPERIQDVLTNLLDNAVKYAPEGGPVEVTAVPDDGVLQVAVRDAGIGIPVEEQARIFERFYRLDRSATREAGGAGLGLYLCRAYVEGMGGRLWVESRPGEGSVFRFTLPIVSAARGEFVPGAPEVVTP